MLQMQQHDYFSVCKLIHHSFEVNWVVLPNIQAISRKNNKIS